MLDFNERIEEAIEALDARVTRDLQRCDEAAAEGDHILALRLGAHAQGMNEAIYVMRRARVPESLRRITDELVTPPRPPLKVVGE